MFRLTYMDIYEFYQILLGDVNNFLSTEPLYTLRFLLNQDDYHTKIKTVGRLIIEYPKLTKKQAQSLVDVVLKLDKSIK